MRVLFFAGGSYVGGMEAVTLTLMKSLIEAGHPAAAVVSGWNDGVYPGQLAQAGVPYREIKLGRLYRSKPLWTLDSIVNFPMAAIALRRFVREFQPDVLVHVDIHMALVAMTALHSGIPNVFHLH
ncbi:MAG: glycosyltransferase family 1 protein, partial [Hyphomicrobiales bacterium]|nr:glycosyltransferase family 1 protein [Hyphomicrobiales bacterium]